jgi:hypothetical protein
MIEVKNGIGMAPTTDEGVPSWEGGPWVADSELVVLTLAKR